MLKLARRRRGGRGLVPPSGGLTAKAGSGTGGRPAGAITAAWFLADFVADVPWAHLDIAGTAWAEGSWAVLPPYMQKDLATGVGVRLLTYFAREWADSPPGSAQS